MEIEKKYKIKTLPLDYENQQYKVIEQGYLCVAPVVRIRRSNDDYILTYKSKIGIDETYNQSTCVCNEVELPLTKESYEHLKTKVDGKIIEKKRYLIPLDDKLMAELDIFDGYLKGLMFVEVEFETIEEANAFVPPDWFGEDVSSDRRYKNNYLASINSLKDEQLV